MLKMALFDCAITMKNVEVLTEDGGIGALFPSPPRGIWQLKSTHPREFAIQGKKMLMPGDQPGGWGGGLGAAGIDRCIISTCPLMGKKLTPSHAAKDPGV